MNNNNNKRGWRGVWEDRRKGTKERRKKERKKERKRKSTANKKIIFPIRRSRATKTVGEKKGKRELIQEELFILFRVFVFR